VVERSEPAVAEIREVLLHSTPAARGRVPANRSFSGGRATWSHPAIAVRGRCRPTSLADPSDLGSKWSCSPAEPSDRDGRHRAAGYRLSLRIRCWWRAVFHAAAGKACLRRGPVCSAPDDVHGSGIGGRRHDAGRSAPKQQYPPPSRRHRVNLTSWPSSSENSISSMAHTVRSCSASLG
jgi:hypothetical protein